jgi:hypothetical protein
MLSLYDELLEGKYLTFSLSSWAAKHDVHTQEILKEITKNRATNHLLISLQLSICAGKVVGNCSYVNRPFLTQL